MNPLPDITAARLRVEKAFHRHFQDGLEIGASLCVWIDGEEVISLHAGAMDKTLRKPWTQDTLAPVYSATKGPAAACMLHALQENRLTPDTLACRIWPALPPHLSVGDILSHQSGLAALKSRAPALDHASVVQALSRDVPEWDPPAHGYHPRTGGYILDELVRRLTGALSLGAYWREAIAAPHGIDFWIGLPASEHSRVATLYPGRFTIPAGEEAFHAAYADPQTLTRRAFLSPSGMHSVAEMNTPAAWSAGFPAFGGVGSAAGLARFYGLLAVGAILSGEAASWARHRLANGMDRVLLLPTAFSAGFMMDPLDAGGKKLRTGFGPNPNSFGHPGAGGSLGFADPDGRIGFAYVMNQMELSVLPGGRVRRLVQSLYGMTE